ncbi:MAG: GspH/FimT family pseudopilin [Methylococcales bacterium]
MMFIHQSKYYKKGFTLIELLVTIAIVGIVAGFGIPSFTQTIKSNRLTTNANQLITSLNFARSEAIKRGVKLYVRRKGATAKNWDSGWDVFIDLNTNQIYNAGTDTLLKTYPPLTNGYTLRTGANYNNWVAFSPTGLTSGSGGLANDSFRVCATAGDLTNSRKISINVVGRARVSTGDVASCP